MRVLTVATCTVLSAVALGPGPRAAMADEMMHTGNARPYPALMTVSRADRQAAQALHRAVNAAAERFDTVESATRLGYLPDPTLSPVSRPGLIHYRKNGSRFWGRVLDARRPQALIFWCPATGDCALAAEMFRTPAGKAPPLYGGALGWHRHFANTGWMTHVWLTRTTQSALAQCAPFTHLHAYNPQLTYAPYKPDVPMIDEACPDTPGVTGASTDMPMG